MQSSRIIVLWPSTNCNIQLFQARHRDIMRLQLLLLGVCCVSGIMAAPTSDVLRQLRELLNDMCKKDAYSLKPTNLNFSF